MDNYIAFFRVWLFSFVVIVLVGNIASTKFNNKRKQSEADLIAKVLNYDKCDYARKGRFVCNDSILIRPEIEVINKKEVKSEE